MIVKLLTEHHLEFLSFKGGCTGLSESTHVKMPHCWKSHVAAHFYFRIILPKYSIESYKCRNMPWNVQINAEFFQGHVVFCLYNELRTRCESCDAYYDILLFLKNGVYSHCKLGHCLDTLFFFHSPVKASCRLSEELPWQLHQSRDKDSLRKCLLNMLVFQKMYARYVLFSWSHGHLCYHGNYTNPGIKFLYESVSSTC